MGQSIIQGPDRSTSAEIRFGAVLDGRAHPMALVWRPRQEWWEFRMWTEDGQPAILGARVVADVDMTQPYNSPLMPAGQIICHDTTNLAQPPGRMDWKERHLLLYVDPVAALPGPNIRITRYVPPPPPGGGPE